MGVYAFWKRSFDIIFSLLVLFTSIPLFLLIAFGILISSEGKIFFVQERLGKGKTVFKCFKFRTMYSNSELILEEVLQKNALLKKEWELKQKLQADPRVFAFGKFLRKSSLDELPQFWNVLIGDLSLVGPRPYIVTQQKELGLYEEQILSVRPGITGLWQTSGRSNTTFQERIILDAEYVKRRCFFLDLYLLAKTVPTVLFSKDAC